MWIVVGLWGFGVGRLDLVCIFCLGVVFVYG